MLGRQNIQDAQPARWQRLTGGAAALALFMAAGTLGLSGCDKKPADDGSSETKSAESKKGDEFRAGSKADMFTFVVEADPETFDTGTMTGAPEGRVAMQLFEGLLVPGPTTEELDDPSELVRPGVAESFEVSEDGKTYTFKLREDAKWSNGDPVTAEDFIYSWQRVLDPDFPANYDSMFDVIKGAEAYRKAKEKLDWSTVGVTSPDPHTLVVELNYPTPYFPELVAFYTFFPVPKKAVEEHGKRWTRPENMLSNGAYKMTSYIPQKEIMLEKNEHYWDKDNVAIDKAKARIIPDRDAVTNAYRAGELHWSGTSLPVSQIASFVSHPDFRSEPLLGVYYFRVNVSNEDSPLAKPEVRRALSMATDRNSLVENVLSGLYTVANAYVPENMAGYEATTKLEYNPRKAKALLKEAGYEDPSKMPKIALLYNSDENHKLVAESIQKQWKSNLGVDVELVNKEWKIYLQDVDTLNYEIARAGWIGDYNDATTFLGMYLTGDGNNNTGWSNEKYDSLLAEAQREADQDERLKILQEAEALLLEDGPVIPVYFYTNNLLISRDVKGFEPHNRDIHLLKYMSLSE